MGKSILELFQTQQIPFKDTGTVETAQKHFAIRNSKDIDNEPSNPLLVPAFKLQKGIRKKLSVKDRETRLEEEVTGLNALMLLSGPALYGTDLFRLKTKTTNMLDDMRAASNGSNTNGLLGGFIKKVEKFGKNLLSKLGVTFPEKLIPTRVVQNTTFKDGLVTDLIKTLQTLKDGSNGSWAGRFLADNTKGGLSGIPNRLVSSGITAAKNALGKALFGSRTEAGQNLAKSGGKYNNEALYSKGVDYTNTNIGDRNDLSTIMLFSSKAGNLNRLVGQKRPPQNKTYNPPINKITSYINTFSVMNGTEYTKVKKKNTIHSTRGFGLGLKGDLLNKLGVAKTNAAGQVFYPMTTTPIDSLDFIPFKFIGLASSNYVYFRAAITSIAETFSPNWESKQFAGNPLPFYSYGHVERALTINFKVFSESENEHSGMWKRLSELGRLVYPQRYSGTALKATAPFIKITIGDMYIDKLGFIESLVYNVPDTAPWEIGMNGGQSDKYKAPMVIEVELTYKFLLGPQNVQESTLYDFGNCNPPVGAPPPNSSATSTSGTKRIPAQTIPTIVTRKPPAPFKIPTKLTTIPNIGSIPPPTAPAPTAPPPTAPPPTAPPPTAPPPTAVITGPPPTATPPPTAIPPTAPPPTGGGGMLGMAPTAPPTGGGGTPDVNTIPLPVPPTPAPTPPTPAPTPDISQITKTQIKTVKTITIPKDTTNIHISIVDNAVIDGDIVDVYVDNDKVVSAETLGYQPINRIINHGRLNKGGVSEYRVTMVALNQGTVGENTALLTVRAFKDGNEYGNARQEIFMSSLKDANGNNKGVSASVVIKTQ
jgi:hypothetical protein